MDSPIPPKRSDVLGAAWARAVWLDKAINEVENDKKAVSAKLKAMVYMCQIHNQLCKTVLYGLKDEELELRIKELEEKLRNGVLIPKNE